jgi:hypothetical protein
LTAKKASDEEQEQRESGQQERGLESVSHKVSDRWLVVSCQLPGKLASENFDLPDWIVPNAGEMQGRHFRKSGLLISGTPLALGLLESET